jgi:hypothetical protein
MLRRVDFSAIPAVRFAYLAGLFDGEGYTYIQCRKRKKPGESDNHMLRIGINSTHEGVIRQLLEEFGGAMNMERRPKNPKWAYSWRWRIGGEYAVALLCHLLPYLCIKRPEIELAIQFQSRLLSRQRHLPDDEVVIRDNLKAELTRLHDAYKQYA